MIRLTKNEAMTAEPKLTCSGKDQIQNNYMLDTRGIIIDFKASRHD